jgi:aryl-alcohol dehydrogenase-like predicted oxidoreductase
MVRDGKVIAWGACVAREDVEAGAAPWLAETAWLAAMRVEMSLCARGAAALVESVRGKLAVLVARPLAGGALAGAIGAGTTWRLRDDRRGLGDGELARVARGVAELSAFTRDVPVAADAERRARVTRVEPVECGNVAELALRWAMARSGGVALPRLHRPEWVASAIAIGAAAPLSGDLMKRLDELDI